MKKLFKIIKTTTYEIHGDKGEAGDVVYAHADGKTDWVKIIDKTIERQDYTFDPEELKFKFSELYKLGDSNLNDYLEKHLNEET